MKRVLESFPILSDCSKLTPEDYSRFSNSYAGYLQKYFPQAKHVAFVFSAGQVEKRYTDSACLAELLSLFTQVKKGMVSYAIHAEYLMLAFDLAGGEKSIAIISGADPLFLRTVSEDWLLEIMGTVEQEFLLLKQNRVDSQTGLLNISNLHSLLEMYGSAEGLQLILLEMGYYLY